MDLSKKSYHLIPLKFIKDFYFSKSLDMAGEIKQSTQSTVKTFQKTLN